MTQATHKRFTHLVNSWLQFPLQLFLVEVDAMKQKLLLQICFKQRKTSQCNMMGRSQI